MTLTLKLSILLLALLVSMLLSLMAGPLWLPPEALLTALWPGQVHDPLQQLVAGARLTRTLTGVVVGAGLAVAGALMQALTRNPMASPGVFGINAGASFAIILLVALLGVQDPRLWLWCALGGAALAGTLVWLIGMRGQGALNPLRMVLAGAALTALFSAFSQALLVVDQQGLDTVLFWLAGSLAERELNTAAPLLLGMLLALVCACLLAAQVNVLSAGHSIAVALGQRVGMLQLGLAGLIICLAGSAVALAGSIGFVGLLVPHMVRRWLSSDHRWLLPGCALAGGSLLLLADVAARLVILPQQVPVGVMTALCGAPLFIALVRRAQRHG